MKNLNIASVGDNSLPDLAVGVGGIKDSVCRRINYIINGTTVTPNGQEDSSLVMGEATVTNPVSTYAKTAGGLAAGKTAACIYNSLNPDTAFYYKIIQIN